MLLQAPSHEATTGAAVDGYCNTFFKLIFTGCFESRVGRSFMHEQVLSPKPQTALMQRRSVFSENAHKNEYENNTQGNTQ